MAPCSTEKELRLQIAVALETMTPEEVRDAVETEIELHQEFVEGSNG